MSYGYSQRLIVANRKADAKSSGVRLGRFCIAQDIPVTQVAGELGVSRATVYNWFTGDCSPTRELCDRIEEWMTQLRESA